MTGDERARRCADAMWARDDASKWAGLSLDAVGEGRAVMSLTVAQHHTNGHDTCHGGVTFLLADSAFAFACNSRNQIAVAQANSITYTAPARAGDRLTATAREVSLVGRNGIYDVTVTRQDGTEIAHFRGGSRIIGGTHFEEGTA
ncbi:acyl-CoA thioesterase [Rubricella aquisinus]|uniref:Acyl-CoA thioesterase n=1 Tax=Rubricella aquisinus TaxID=2028108 RepID=A0A840X0J9_9RHOB|nr:hydroxyphenylacetyl-CoA thioesterase PaaI [Rubricella aquisinus]MBB5514187.1 acyl-CoA thioesterase [Rubricella aquisinus]